MSIEQKIGFDKIKQKLDIFFQGTLGRSKLSEINLMTDKLLIDRELNYVSEFNKIISKNTFPGGNFEDLRANLERIRIENSYLVEEELSILQQSIATINEILLFFKKEESQADYPNLCEKAMQIKYYPFILSSIKNILSKEGRIKDTASRELRRIRNELRSKEAQISGIVHKALTEIEKQGYLEGDGGVVIRNGKMLVPVPVAHKNKINGVVQDYSGSGKTVYIEPLKSIELNNNIRLLGFEEKREIIKILTEITNTLRPYLDDLFLGYEFLSEIDFIRAKARLSIEMFASRPKITNTQNISLRNAFHPLLFLSYKESSKKVVPLDLELDEDNRITLISGPNAGGKSIAVKTVILIQYMLQCGFLVPAKNTSEFGIFSNFFVDIGDNQSLESDLSTYSSHLFNMKNILEKSDNKSLVIIDEFGSGTDPAIGGAIAEAILEELLKKNVRAVINTHYSNLKYFAVQNSGITNAAMLFDNKNLRPLYLINSGNPGSSFAFEIAENIGLPRDIIERAKEKTGQKAVDFDKIITEIDFQSNKIKEERAEILKIKHELTNKIKQYKDEKEKIVLNKKKVIDELSRKSDELLRNMNRSIEKTILDIKNKKAEKEITKELRKNLEDQKKEFIRSIEKEKKSISKQEKKIKPKKDKINKPKNNVIKSGDFVRHKKNAVKGKVEAIKDGMAMLIVGNLRTFVKLSELEKVADITASDKQVKVKIDMDTVETEDFIFGLDVRGKRAEEAMEIVVKYIDNALVKNATNLRILHGTGNGILRQLIRKYLRKHSYVEWYGDADIRQGGQGITLVKMKD